MATTPVPRNFNRVLGDQADTVLFRLGLKKLKAGGAVLSLLEAAAMSDVRNSADIFNLLNSIVLDSAEGEAVDQIARQEGLERFSAKSASGSVTIGDSRFSKISTRIYQGKPAPIVGSAVLFVVDASAMSASGNVFIGRGTSNSEGPLSYTSKSNLGGYWSLALAPGSHTQFFHNTGEDVIFAQGGNRTLGAGTVAQTPPNGSADPVQFSTLYQSVILDGEVQVENVAVVAKISGIGGNVPNGAISSLTTAPFSGATVTNPLPFSNGQQIESDDELKDRIRAIRQSRNLGTSTAIKTYALGVESPDEHKRVSSASLVRRNGQSSILYIDDGSGYEEIDLGQSIESLTDDAVGGELRFKLEQRPVESANVVTTTTAPFALADGMKIAVLMGGVRSEHTLTAGDFRNIGNATSFEIASSINAAPALLFLARTSDNGSTVTLSAKSDTNDDIEVVAPSSGIDANNVLLFPSARHDTLRLYKNDRLLSKDGTLASIESNPASTWGAISGSQTLVVAVDGTAPVTYTFTDQDFINAGTGFVTIGTNTTDAWAKVLTAKIPGITAESELDTIVITSNVGRLARAEIAISGGSLVSIQMFDIKTSTGTAKDYALDRHRGDIELSVALSAGDTLSAGSASTRSFAQSSAAIDPIDLVADGHAYVAVDGRASLIPTGITSAATFNITKPQAGAWGARYRIAATSGTPFSNVAQGDWLIIWDSTAAWDEFRGILRIAAATGSFIEVEADDPGGVVASGVSFLEAGISVVRYDGQLQDIVIPAGTNYTADSFVAAINSTLIGAAAETYRSQVRVRTNTFEPEGDLGVVAVDVEGVKIGIKPADAEINKNSHLGSIESGNPETGTPMFEDLSVDSSADDVTVSINPIGGFPPDRCLVGLKNHLIVSSNDRFGNNRSFRSFIDHVVEGGAPHTLTLRKAVPKLWQPQDRLYMASPFAMTPEDDLIVLIDGDATSKRYDVPLWRSLRPTSSTYGATNGFKDIGDGTGSPVFLSAAFGKTFDFNDFALYMKARAKSHSATASKATLWRYKRFGGEGNAAAVYHGYPQAASQAISVNVDSLPITQDSGATNIEILLPSGAPRTGYTLRNSSSLGLGYHQGADPLPTVTIALGFSIASASRTSNVNTLTLTLPSGAYSITTHGLVGGNQIWVQSSNGSFSSGLKTIIGVGATTITYAEVAADIGPAANIGTVSFDSTGEARFAGGSIGIGDLIHLANVSNIPAQWRGQTIRITQVGNQFLQGPAEISSGSEDLTLHWNAIANAENVQIYPLNATGATATAIAAAVNSMSGQVPVTATVLGSGTGQILLSTRDELGFENAGYQLTDGVNWVRTTNDPPDLSTDTSFLFKSAITADLVSSSDWANEEVRMVPTTAKNIVDWMNCLGISGVSSVAGIAASDQARRVQLTTLESGSRGSVQIQGGTASVATSMVNGSADASATFMRASFEAADMVGFRGQQWVSLDNNTVTPNSTVFDATSALNSIASNGTFTLGAGVPLYTILATSAHPKIQIEKQGNFVFVAGVDNTIAGREGDWLYITVPDDASSPVVNAANQGFFRIVRQDSNGAGYWIENPSAVVENEVFCGAKILSSDSLIPGDTVSISTDLWGVNNKGNWVVTKVGSATNFDNTLVFHVDTTARTPQVISAPVGALGSTEARKVLVMDAKPARLIKRIHGIAPNQTDPLLVDVVFDSANRFGVVGEVSGTVMTALDKLAFSPLPSQGIDGYRYGVGLIGETTRVLYGDDDDSITYPGVIAEGATVNISGPLVRRIAVSVVVRAQSGVPRQDIAAQVRSVVASAINKTGVGESIAFSVLVEAAQSVNGVIAISIRSPEYDTGHDLIAIQPQEKALVLDVDADIDVSFVG